MAASVPPDGPPLTKMEFAVRMTCQSCVDVVKKSLESVQGVRSVYVSLPEELVVVETSLPSGTVQQRLEATGRLVVFRGYGGDMQQAPSSSHHGAAVAILQGGGGVRGLVRMVQVTPEQCVMEGTVDGLTPGQHAIQVHQYGDLSEGCASCGDMYTTPDSTVAGHMATVAADRTGRATFQVVSEQLKVWDVIGRSMVVHGCTPSSSQLENRVMCGIIARSAGLFQNMKKVCTCDGVTIWEEAEKAKTRTRAAL